MAVGNVGERLLASDGDLQTYISRDAGDTWSVVGGGSHVYDVGDQGGLMVAARNDGATSMVRVSVDGGVSFKQCEFAQGKEVEVRDKRVSTTHIPP